MPVVNLKTNSEQETIQLGESLARQLKGGDIVCLHGELGAGKTTLVKGIGKGLKVRESNINSPTFVLMNVYEGKTPIYHYDLYRLGDRFSMETIGLDEFLYRDGIAVIEWADKMGELTPKEYLNIKLKHNKNQGRSITLSAKGKRYKDILEKL